MKFLITASAEWLNEATPQKRHGSHRSHGTKHKDCIGPSARGSAVAYPGQGTLETRHREGSTGLLFRKYRGKKTESLIHTRIMVP